MGMYTQQKRRKQHSISRMYRPKNQNGKNEGQKDKKMVYKWIGKAIEENKKINNPIQIEKKSVTQTNTTIMTTGKENGTTTLKLVEGGATVSNPYTEMGSMSFATIIK